MKKLLSVIFLLMCVITMSAQMSHPVMIWHKGYKMTFTGIDSVTFVKSPSVPETEYVDLGLKVKWATCNLGATSPEEHGDYFAWGETKTKNRYDETTYKYCNGSLRRLTKYNSDSSEGNEGFKDNKYELDPDDDVAIVLKGKGWRMPTVEDVEELQDKCTWKEEEQNEIKGYRITGPNGNSMFIPYAGERNGTTRSDLGFIGCYWLSIIPSNPAWAHTLYFNRNTGGIRVNTEARTSGLPIRPVHP